MPTKTVRNSGVLSVLRLVRNQNNESFTAPGGVVITTLVENNKNLVGFTSQSGVSEFYSSRDHIQTGSPQQNTPV